MIEVNEDRALLDVFNSYEHPGIEAHVFVVLGRGGTIHVTVRPVEAWELWAKSHGYKDWTAFAEDFEDEIEWSDNGRRGSIDDGGGSIQSVPLIGFYRDGVKHL
jgi:hypothetical protein